MATDTDFIDDPITQAAPQDPQIPEQPSPDDPGDGVVEPIGGEVVTDQDQPDTTPPDSDQATIPPTTGVADYSGETDATKGYEEPDYTVPEAGDAPMPTSSGTADPTQTVWEVTDEQTVAGQLQKLYDRDSPFFEQARQRAIRQHLASGGQNSAMAAGFGEMAAMDQAFKVAQQDAALYARSAEFNTAMANQYSLAEQRFIHNAMLSDQAFEQAKVLQTQRVAAQLEAINLQFKNQAAIMDKELDQWFLKSKQEFAYELGVIGAQMDATMRVNAMQAMSNFYIAGFQAVMAAANNPNLTPEQSAAAIREGMNWFNQQKAAFNDMLLGQVNALGSGNQAAQSFLPGGSTSPTGGQSSMTVDANGYYNWAYYPTQGGNGNYMVDPYTGQPVYGSSGQWPTDSSGQPLPYNEAWQTMYGGGAGGATPYGPYGFGNQGWGFLGGTSTGG